MDSSICISADGLNLNSSNECPRYDNKPFYREAPVLELLEMWSTPSSPLLPGSIGLGMVVLVRVPSMRQIKLFYHLTMCKQMSNVEL